MDSTKEYKMGMDFTAKTFAGLEEVLAEELRQIGADDVEIIKRGVKFRGDTAVMYKANYTCRTALRILKPVGVFEVKTDEDLYEKVKKIDWTKVFNLEQTFIVNANLFHSELDHSHYAALRTKDGIVDQFRDKTGKRPWVGKEDADIYIDVHMSHNLCTISLDSSGESLHRRGYRISADKAPISEVLAAGMVMLSGWDGKVDFYDPMCGSGTIPIEAAMIGMHIPSGYYREKFAFMSWADHDATRWNEVKTSEDEKMTDLECDIFASDRSDKAIAITKRNLKNTGLHKDVHLKVQYMDSIQPREKKGILIFNPPYGKRLEERGDIFNLYRSIGDVLKQNFTGFEAWIITSNMDAAKVVGLRPSARLSLYNGPLEAKFIKFEMYEGSKKDLYEDQPGERKDYRKKEGGQDKGFQKRRSDGEKDYRKSDSGEKKSFRRRDDDKKESRKRDDEGRKDYRKRGDNDKKDFRKNDRGKKPYGKPSERFSKNDERPKKPPGPEIRSLNDERE